ncbi:MAG: hypothetical protein ACLP0J_05290 [Solirubrobacteraceae bacterium]
MARMTLKAVPVDGERRRLPLSERIVDENLGSYHHVPRPRERLRAATADAGSASRDQRSLLRIITTIMLGMLTRVIRRRGARDVAPTMMSTTKRSWTWRGHTRGLTRICVSAGASLAARLIAPRKAAWAPPGVQPAR